MEKIVIGKYVSTHGIKGEIKIKSNFKYKDRVFKINNKIYINNKEFIIKSYRIHKDYDMVTLNDIYSINDILPLKGSLVYINKEDLNLNESEYLDNDLINFDVYIGNEIKGKVNDINYLTKNKKLLVVNNKLVPFELIIKIDLNDKKIILEDVGGLL